jgi:endonuclease-8
MRMNGSWHTYRTGERWRRSSRDMRIVIATEDAVAVGFNIPVAELLTARQLARHTQLLALGPDLLDRAFDRAEARQRMRACGGDAIGDTLLNQRVVSGIGNVFKSEILFVAQVDPFARVQDLADETLERIFNVALAQLRANVASGTQAPARAGAWRGRRTTGSLHPDKGLWVYGRGGLPCRKCGTTIVAKKTSVDARLTYSCPRCQPAGDAVSRTG